MFAVATFAILGTMGLALTRAFRGPTVFDRLLAVNMFGTKTVLLIAVLGFLDGRPEFLDIALVYAMISFIGGIAVLRFFEKGRFDPDEGEEHGDGASEGTGEGTGDGGRGEVRV